MKIIEQSRRQYEGQEIPYRIRAIEAQAVQENGVGTLKIFPVGEKSLSAIFEDLKAYNTIRKICAAELEYEFNLEPYVELLVSIDRGRMWESSTLIVSGRLSEIGEHLFSAQFMSESSRRALDDFIAQGKPGKKRPATFTSRSQTDKN